MSAIENYINTFPESTQEKLRQIYDAIETEAKDAEESLSYGMPAFKTNQKPLVYFAGYKHHIGFYATPSGHDEFASELSTFKQGKGSVQFPLDAPLPIDLIRKIVAFKIEENNRK